MLRRLRDFLIFSFQNFGVPVLAVVAVYRQVVAFRRHRRKKFIILVFMEAGGGHRISRPLAPGKDIRFFCQNLLRYGDDLLDLGTCH